MVAIGQLSVIDQRLAKHASDAVAAHQCHERDVIFTSHVKPMSK